MWTLIPSQPSIALAPYIQFYWVGQVPPGDSLPVAFLPPTGYTSILLTYGKNPIQLRNYGEKLQVAPQAIVLGQYYNNLEARIPDCFDIIGILFKPSVFHRFFGFDMQEFTHKMLPAEDVFGNDIIRLVQRLKEAKSDVARLEEVERYFLRMFKNPKYQTQAIDAALDLMIAKKGIVPVNEVSNYFKCSTRSLERKFKNHTGISPKYMNRIIQFNHMLSILKMQPSIRWSELAHRTGYYDQSHLITAFLEFTGSSPVQYHQIDNEITQFYLE